MEHEHRQQRVRVWRAMQLFMQDCKTCVLSHSKAVDTAGPSHRRICAVSPVCTSKIAFCIEVVASFHTVQARSLGDWLGLVVSGVHASPLFLQGWGRESNLSSGDWIARVIQTACCRAGRQDDEEGTTVTSRRCSAMSAQGSVSRIRSVLIAVLVWQFSLFGSCFGICCDLTASAATCQAFPSSSSKAPTSLSGRNVCQCSGQ